MRAYVLTGWVQYEGDWVLGVFSTPELANAAVERNREQRRKEQRFSFEGYNVQDYELDAEDE